jgi:hypothetical protein
MEVTSHSSDDFVINRLQKLYKKSIELDENILLIYCSIKLSFEIEISFLSCLEIIGF